MSLLVCELNNGVLMPAIGFGTWELKNDQSTTALTSQVLELGYRHVDTADAYKNQDALGDALKQTAPPPTSSVPSSSSSSSSSSPPSAQFKVVSAEEFEKNLKEKAPTAHPSIFTTGKVFTDSFGSEEKVRECVQRFRDQIGSAPTLCLLHWPSGHFKSPGFETGFTFGTKEEQEDKNKNEATRLRNWKTLEKLVAEGAIVSAGVANYNLGHISHLVADIEQRKSAGDKNAMLPAMNQIEITPLCQPAPELVAFCREKKIHITAYSSLGSKDTRLGGKVRQHEKLSAIGKAHNKSACQVLLRWALQRGFVIIPRTSQLAHAKENLDILDFEISPEEMKDIDSLHTNERSCPNPDSIA